MSSSPSSPSSFAATARAGAERESEIGAFFVVDCRGVPFVLHAHTFLGGKRLRVVDFQYATSAADKTDRSYVDLHMFFNCILQRYAFLCESHRSAEPEHKAATIPEEFLRFLQDVVPEKFRYKDVADIATGRLGDGDPQLFSPADLLTGHPFFEPVRSPLIND